MEVCLWSENFSSSNKKNLVNNSISITRDFKDLEVFFEPALFGSGYAWIFPHNNFVSIGCATDLKSQLNLFKNFHYWLKKMKIEINPAELESFPINFDYRGFKFGNIFLVGDAAGFASGLTGEGIYAAILSGKEVARKILNPNYNFPEMKKLLKKKFLEERVGKTLIFPILKSKKLTEFIFKRFL
jgi:geranylgeranyl reductase